MRIQLYDRGTPQGKKLLKDLDNLCEQLQLGISPEYFTDMSRVYSMGLQGKTILLIDGEVALIDRYPSQNELASIIADFQK